MAFPGGLTPAMQEAYLMMLAHHGHGHGHGHGHDHSKIGFLNQDFEDMRIGPPIEKRKESVKERTAARLKGFFSK